MSKMCFLAYLSDNPMQSIHQYEVIHWRGVHVKTHLQYVIVVGRDTET